MVVPLIYKLGDKIHIIIIIIIKMLWYDLLCFCRVRLQKKAKDAADVEYPAYGVTGPNKEATPTGDRRLAHSAQMYHYQLTKQTIIAMDGWLTIH